MFLPDLRNMMIGKISQLLSKITDLAGGENMKKQGVIIGLVLLISLSSVLANDPVEAGIEASSLENATVYSNQKVIIRDIDNNQMMVTFDKFVVSGNQRWGFNYKEAAKSFMNKLFSLANVFFAADYENMPSEQVSEDVKNLIDSTKIDED